MPTILKIGYTYYLMREAQATAALKALAGAVLLDHKHSGTDYRREVFWPDPRRNTEIGLEVVKANQLLAAAPPDSFEPDTDEASITPPPKKVLRLGNGS